MIWKKLMILHWITVIETNRSLTQFPLFPGHSARWQVSASLTFRFDCSLSSGPWNVSGSDTHFHFWKQASTFADSTFENKPFVIFWSLFHLLAKCRIQWRTLNPRDLRNQAHWIPQESLPPENPVDLYWVQSKQKCQTSEIPRLAYYSS